MNKLPFAATALSVLFCAGVAVAEGNAPAFDDRPEKAAAFGLDGPNTTDTLNRANSDESKEMTEVSSHRPTYQRDTNPAETPAGDKANGGLNPDGAYFE